MTHEHVFHQDGTVEWHDAKDEPRKEPRVTREQGPETKERPKYAALRVADDIYLVSYLAGSGYTLTVVLNFRDQRVAGFASSATEWHLVQGRFEVVG
jgi:hypothetical protein